MTGNYYAEKLNSANLFRVYETALPRVRQYLEAEIDFVRRDLGGTERVLEIGAGYGRIMRELAPFAAAVTGIDISEDSVTLGREYLKEFPNCRLEVMDAHELAFDGEFDVTLCLQNGLSALQGEAEDLVRRCLAALVPGGRAYFGTYSPKFWDHRLAWFREQADKGLLGEIDPERTGNGVIVCRDGFRAVSFSEEDLKALGEASGCPYRVREVDGSSLFLLLERPSER